jgi:Ser/Thr protein kinase RdoA (MazF antagonist)
MSTATSLTTEEGLRAYLEAHSKQIADIQLLTGGTANYVYRVSLRDGKTTKTVIYKHAAPYLHSNTSFSFDTARMDYEALALEALPALITQELPSSRVHPAERYSYDNEAKLLCIEDGGERNLKTAYADPTLDIPAIGREIGTWLAALHRSSTAFSFSGTDAKDLQTNNPIAVQIYRYSYQGLVSALAEYGHDAELGKRINEEFGSKLATDNDCVCHGDFWPGNVLVRPAGSDEQRVFDLTVVDWEMVRRGTSATDVGQFAAEAYLLDRFQGGRGLRAAFLDAYAAAEEGVGKIDREWIRRMAVHWGTHVAFWPTRVQWADREGTQKLVDIGVEVLRWAAEGDFDKLRASELFGGLGDVWDRFWLDV